MLKATIMIIDSIYLSIYGLSTAGIAVVAHTIINAFHLAEI